MTLSKHERAYVNSPLHALLHKHVLPRVFNRLYKLPPGAHVLELGCGNGVGTRELLAQWPIGHVTATDIDETTLSRAQFYLDNHLGPHQFSLRKADATTLPFPARRFDAVIACGVLSHVEDWPKALAEIHRVLKPGGVCYIWDLYRPLLENRMARKVFARPANRFDHHSLQQVLGANHLYPLGEKNTFNLTGFQVARRAATDTASN